METHDRPHVGFTKIQAHISRRTAKPNPDATPAWLANRGGQGAAAPKRSASETLAAWIASKKRNVRDAHRAARGR